MALTVKNLEIGNGTPKICVPIIGKTFDEIEKQIMEVLEYPYDLIEWRSDAFNYAMDAESTAEVLRMLRQRISNTPLIFTLRTSSEGGFTKVSDDQYEQICRNAATFGTFDFIDIEFNRTCARDIIKYAHEKSVKVIASNHDFEKTPPKDVMMRRLKAMYKMDADILKIAVMPQNSSDVVNLLTVTSEFKNWQSDAHPDDVRPLITISMGELGKISRISGSTFGSDITFATAKKASAPGQIEAKALKSILQTLQ